MYVPIRGLGGVRGGAGGDGGAPRELASDFCNPPLLNKLRFSDQAYSLWIFRAQRTEHDFGGMLGANFIVTSYRSRLAVSEKTSIRF